jgi:thioredoxin reductase (NADPH)
MGKPVLLSVDDDPAVSRAVARDLRRRYGEDYRVLRASSAAEGLDALRELKRRGDPVAVLLADHRMPQTNGIDFLEQAVDLFPRARRALLTADADPEAAIRAINPVDVDQYLLEPWEPVEERLYHRWSAPSLHARDLLARNAVPYRWCSADEAEGERPPAAAGAGPDDVPVIVPPDGRPLVAPSDPELATVVGLDVDPREQRVLLPL